jgi:glycosyltransferase involved in cell wall biosynthesis
VLLARLLGIKCAIAAGGYDVTTIPTLGYGALADATERWKVKIALRGAHAVFPTSDLLADEVRRLGRLHNVRVIYPGVDCERFAPGAERKRLVVTVGTVGRSTWRLKGLDVFAACSRLLPDVRFAVIGPCPDADVAQALREAGGPNLTLVGALAAEGVARWFRDATVYAQLSARESFGLALAEAMSAGCVPVATAAGFMPEVVGDTGFLVEYGNAPAAAEAITQALASDEGPRARLRVRSLYPVERRTRELRESIERLLT